MPKIIKSFFIIILALLVIAGAFVLLAAPESSFASSLQVIGDALGIKVEGEGPLFDQENLAPGDTACSSVTIINKGENPFSYTLSSEQESGSEDLFNNLQITVTGGVHNYSGPLSGLKQHFMGRLPAKGQHLLNLTVLFPGDVDNDLRNAALSTKFIFSAALHIPYIVTVAADPPTGGSVSGGGTYEYPEEVVLTAAPNPGYKFIYWWDGSTIAGREELRSLDLKQYGENTVLDLVANFWKTTAATVERELYFDADGKVVLQFPGTDVRINITGGIPGERLILAVTPLACESPGAPTGYSSSGPCLRIDGSKNLSGLSARIEVTYNRSALPDKMIENSLRLFRYNEQNGDWEVFDTPAGGVDTNQRIVWAEVNGFSVFRIFGKRTAGPPVTPEEPYLPGTVERIAGADRYRTAVAISREGWNYAGTVILARGDDFADALAGVPLAYKLNAPVLLTATGSLNGYTKQEIRRLQPGKVIILGGSSAVSAAVQTELALLGYATERLGGANRFDTATIISHKMAPYGTDKAIVAYGWDFPDVLAASSYAACFGYPILLTEKGSLPVSTVSELNRLKGLNFGFRTIAVGGTAVIGSAVYDRLPGRERIWGENRYQTAVELARYFEPVSDTLYIATGLKFPDAVTGAALAAKNNCGILLVKDPLETAVSRYISGRGVKHLLIFGGEEAVSRELYNKLWGLIE